MYSTSWGAEVSPQGKIVWFEPADGTEDPESGPAPAGEVFDLGGVVDQRLAGAGEPADRIDVHLLSMPVQVFAHYRGWYDELRRELRLLALNHASDYPFASELSELTLQVEQERRQAVGIDRLDAAIAAGDGPGGPGVPRPGDRRRDDGPAARAARAGRRLLPRAAAAHPRAGPAAAGAAELVPRRVHPPGRRARQPTPWPGSFTVEVPPR